MVLNPNGSLIFNKVNKHIMLFQNICGKNINTNELVMLASMFYSIDSMSRTTLPVNLNDKT